MNADFLRETIDVVRQLETRFLELGSRIFKIRTEKLWEGTYDSFNEFLDAAHLTPGNASMLATVHEFYVLKGGVSHERLAGAGYSNLYTAIPLIEKDGIDKTVEKARLLTRSELNDEVRESKGTECEHELITICSKCHKRIYEGK